MVCFNWWTGPERCFLLFTTLSHFSSKKLFFSVFSHIYTCWRSILLLPYHNWKGNIMSIPKWNWNWNADSSWIGSLSLGWKIALKNSAFHDLTFAHQDKTNHILLLILIEPQLGSSLSKPLAWLSLFHQWKPGWAMYQIPWYRKTSSKSEIICTFRDQNNTAHSCSAVGMIGTI